MFGKLSNFAKPNIQNTLREILLLLFTHFFIAVLVFYINLNVNSIWSCISLHDGGSGEFTVRAESLPEG